MMSNQMTEEERRAARAEWWQLFKELLKNTMQGYVVIASTKEDGTLVLTKTHYSTLLKTWKAQIGGRR